MVILLALDFRGKGESIYGDGFNSVYGPGPYHNLTVVPGEDGRLREFYVPSGGEYTETSRYILIIILMLMGQTVIHSSRALLIFRPSTFHMVLGLVICGSMFGAYCITIPGYIQAAMDGYYSEETLALFNMGGERERGAFNAVSANMRLTLTSSSALTVRPSLLSPALMMLLAPVLTLAWFQKFSSIPSVPTSNGAICKAFLIFLIYVLYEMIVSLSIIRFILPQFYSPDATMLTRFIIRSVVQSGVLLFHVEVAWKMSLYLERLGVRPADANVMMVYGITGISIFGRIMQGSASTLSESLLYEVSGTISELFVCDSLLKGQTPLEGNVVMARQLSGRLSQRISFKKADAVAPAPAPQEDLETTRDLKNEEAPEKEAAEAKESKDDEEKKKTRSRYCIFVLIVIAISEAAGIFTSTIFWCSMNANPQGAPGSPAVPLTQTLVNLAVMLFGELFFTDSIVAYVARKSSRYCNDPAAEWHELRKDGRHISGVAATIAFSLMICIIVIPNNMCYTSWLGEGEDEWVLTTCPKAPGNETEMIRAWGEGDV